MKGKREGKKAFLLRLDPRLYRVLEKWAQDELRSVNAQIEYLLKEAAKRAGRWKDEGEAGTQEGRES
ncbi:hypothetical protein [Thermus sp.]|mgnify:CR=1 FL=1